MYLSILQVNDDLNWFKFVDQSLKINSIMMAKWTKNSFNVMFIFAIHRLVKHLKTKLFDWQHHLRFKMQSTNTINRLITNILKLIENVQPQVIYFIHSTVFSQTCQIIMYYYTFVRGHVLLLFVHMQVICFFFFFLCRMVCCPVAYSILFKYILTMSRNAISVTIPVVYLIILANTFTV